MTEGFKPNSKIRLKITDIVMMLLINEKCPDRHFTISGVDRLFIAPELYKKKEVSPLNDVYSIGIILYLLITGGRNKKKNEEKFDFREDVWLTVSEDLTEFMLACTADNPRKRMSISDLQDHPFIKMKNLGKLDVNPLMETTLLE